MGRPRLILVTGPAGSGKTTLADALGTAIGCPVVSRDAIKEGMVAAEPVFTVAPDDPLTRRAYGVFFAMLDLLLRAEVTTLAEAAFQHQVWLEGLRPLTELADLRLIRCVLPETEARRRVQRRLDTNPTRAAHADREHLLSPPNFVPLALDVPMLDVQTRARYEPALEAVVAFCLT